MPRWSTEKIPVVQIRRALRRHEGIVAYAARELGLDEGQLHYKIRKAGLRPVLEELRSKRRERHYEQVVHLLVKHQGNVTAVARKLGRRQSSLDARLERYGLRDFVIALRPRKPSPSEERAIILASIRRHSGQVKNVREELGVSKGTLLARMRKHDLFAEADALRAEKSLMGPRTRLPKGRHRGRRRAKLVALLESCDWNVQRALRLSGVSNGTFYSLIREFKIERPTQRFKQQKLHRLIDALRLGHGVRERAAKLLGIDPRTVNRWCEELDVDPRDYRR